MKLEEIQDHGWYVWGVESWGGRGGGRGKKKVVPAEPVKPVMKANRLSRGAIYSL